MLASCTKSEVKGHFGLCGLVVIMWMDLETKYCNVKYLVGTVDDQKEGFILIFRLRVVDVEQLHQDLLRPE